MSIIYCDFCNRSAPRNEWDGFFTDSGESMCSQCEFDGMAIVETEYEFVPNLLKEWNN